MKTEKEIVLDKAIAWYDSGHEDKEEFINLITELLDYRDQAEMPKNNPAQCE